MLKTGNTFIDYLLVAIRFLPLLPVLLIFFKKLYLKEPLNFLLILCLLDFVAGLIRQSAILNAGHQSVVNNVFFILEWILLSQLFKATLSGKIREQLNIFLIIVLSILFTFYSLRGWDFNSPLLNTLQGCLILAVVFLSLPPLVRNSGLHVFGSPLLWIAGGCLFYYPIFILLEWLGTGWLPLCQCPADMEKLAMLSIAGFVRYVLYTMAVLFYPPQPSVS